MLKNKISKDDFFEYLKLLRKNASVVNAVYEASNKSIDLINFETDICEPYLIIVKAFFTKDELDIIDWYLYEFRENDMKIWDSETGEEIVNLVDDEALWEYLNRE